MNASELREIVKGVQSDEHMPAIDIAEGWLHWFQKRGDRCLKDAAKLGYTEVTLDLPVEIGQSFNRAALLLIQRGVKELTEGCFVGFIEDDYEGRPLCRLVVSWK